MGPDRERIVSLQILRFVAVAMVVFFHAAFVAQGVTGHAAVLGVRAAATVGPAGVDIFFVLSGLVIAMTGPLAMPRPSGVVFFWHRWRRVVPVYFIISLPLVVAAGYAGALSADRLAATFLFWPAAGAQVVTPYLPAGWTLCFEMVFYSGVALLLAGGRLRRNLIIGVSACLLLIGLRAAFGGSGLRFLVNPIFAEFAAGASLAALRPRLFRLSLLAGSGLVLLGFGVLAAEAILGVGDIGDVLHGVGVFQRLILFGLPAVAIVAGAMICERRCGGAFAALLAKGGDASYSIYLSHIITFYGFVVVWRAARMPANPNLAVAVGLAMALAVGLICHQVIERPILRDLKRLKWPVRGAVATAEALSV